MARNYKKEYANYQGKPEQIKKRSSRNKARRKLLSQGKAVAGKDVDHKDGNPMNNKTSNLSVKSKKDNRSFPRNKNAGKK